MPNTVVDVEFKEPHEEITFLLENEQIITINVDELGGPGVWRRVLTKLEEQGGVDLNHLMPAWKYNLIGSWWY